jgi:PIN domain nuclease of toxin-antitoxin system
LKLLLDTHIWIWSISEPGKLSRRIVREIEDQSNELWLSPVSIWEALLLHNKRRIHFEGTARDWVAKSTSRFREAPLTAEIAVAAHELSLANADPADRFLAATAEILRLTLVTADIRLLGLGTIATLANR